MATTGQNFVRLVAAQLVAAAVVAAGKVLALNPSNADQVVLSGAAVNLDRQTANLATQAYALNGAATLSLSGTSAKDFTLTSLSTAAASSAGDLVFASASQLTFKNLGAGDATIAAGASNGFAFPLNGTTPTITLAAGDSFTFTFATAITVDSTHKLITITPVATTIVSVCVGGA